MLLSICLFMTNVDLYIKLDFTFFFTDGEIISCTENWRGQGQLKTPPDLVCVSITSNKNLKYRLSPELVKSKGQAVSGAVTAARKQHVFPHHQQMDVQERTPCLHVSSRMSGSPSLPMKVQLLSWKITGCLPSNEKQLCSQ